MIKSNEFLYIKNENTHARRLVVDTHARLWMSATLFTTDMLSLFIAFVIAIKFRGLLQLLASPSYKELFVLLALIISVLFYRKGLYPGVGVHYIDEFRHIVTSTALAFLILIGVTFLLHTSLVYSRFILMLAGALATGLIPFSRYFIRRLMIRLGLWGEPALIIGDAYKAQKLANYFLVNLHLGILPVTHLNDKQLVHTMDHVICPLKPLCGINFISRNFSIKTALVLMNEVESAHDLAEKYRFAFQRVILIRDQKESFALTSLQTLDFLNIIGLQVKNDLLSGSSQAVKRIVDIFGAFLGLLIFSPLMAMVAIFIKLGSRGTVFYRQPRVGRNGAVFQLLKFRTMHYNAGQIFKEALENDIRLQNEWTLYQKLQHDPRVTRIGGFLRRFSIDELPQLWNVLVGDMSLVGPRPFMLDQRKLYGENLKYYYLVLPGMTGLWQVSGRSGTTFDRRALLDREYLERWSPWLDFYIILKTIKTVLFEKSAY